MNGSVSGIILAGGANKRFGGLIKSNIVVDGETIVSGIIEKLSVFFEEIIVVTNSPEEFSQYQGIKITGDIFINSGPLGGIHSGMKLSSNEAVFVFAGDMPLLDTGIIRRQIDLWKSNSYDILVPRIGENIEPLHSIYSKSVLPLLEDYLSGRNICAVRDFFRLVNVGYFDPGENEESVRAFTNVNYPSDLEALTRNRKGC